MGFIRVTGRKTRQCIRINIDAIGSYYNAVFADSHIETEIDMIDGKTSFYVLESPESIDELIRKEERDVSLNTHDR